MRARSKLKTYDAANREAALLILANPKKYEGLMLEWARLIAGKNFNPKTGGMPPEKRGVAHANFCEGRR